MSKTPGQVHVINLNAYRYARFGFVDSKHAIIRSGDDGKAETIIVEAMRFRDLCTWLQRQTHIRETTIVQAKIRFSGSGDGHVARVLLSTRPDPSLVSAMPFEVSAVPNGAVMLNAYDYMVREGRYPADTIIAAYPDGWVALESSATYHGCVPDDAYEATSAWPV